MNKFGFIKIMNSGSLKDTIKSVKMQASHIVG